MCCAANLVLIFYSKKTKNFILHYFGLYFAFLKQAIENLLFLIENSSFLNNFWWVPLVIFYIEPKKD
jgi:hypothetical protein